MPRNAIVAPWAAVFTLLLMLSLPRPTAAQASFDCGGTLTPVETTICGNPGLAQLDRQLMAAYRDALKVLPPEQGAVAIAAQRHWLVQRDSCGISIFCLRNAYTVRLQQLSAAAAAAPAPGATATSNGNDRACMTLFRNRCPDLADLPNFVGLCYNRNPEVFAHIPANCSAAFDTAIQQTISAPRNEAEANSRHLPYPGMSLGGQVRSGPGMNYSKVASLGENAPAPLTILKDTGLTMDGYHWFQIAWGHAATGYEWGGIMCSDDFKLNGIFEACKNP